MGAIFMAMVGMQAQAAPLGDGLGEGIASSFDQATDSEEQTQATAEVVWTGTPLEGYVNIAIANVDDSLNIREAADGSGSLVGKLRKNGACEVLGIDGEWAHIKSGEVEGYVKAEYLYTGQEAIDLAFQLGQTMAKVNTDSLYVRMEPSTDADKLAEVRTEIVYRYLHPLKGEMIVRCGGVRDMSEKGFIYTMGTHQDISETVRLEREREMERMPKAAACRQASVISSSVRICSMGSHSMPSGIQ